MLLDAGSCRIQARGVDYATAMPLSLGHATNVGPADRFSLIQNLNQPKLHDLQTLALAQNSLNAATTPKDGELEGGIRLPSSLGRESKGRRTNEIDLAYILRALAFNSRKDILCRNSNSFAAHGGGMRGGTKESQVA